MRSVRTLLVALAWALATVLATSAAAVADPYEPNDSLAQAYGPLMGGVDYGGGAIDTDNDQDWFVFFVARQAQVDITWTTVANPSGFGFCPLLWFLTSEGSFITSGDSVVDCPGSGHLLHTSPGPAKYYLQVFGDLGGTYSLRVDPASALTSRPLPQPSATNPTTQPTNPATSQESQLLNQAQERLRQFRRLLRVARRDHQLTARQLATLRGAWRKVRTLIARLRRGAFPDLHLTPAEVQRLGDLFGEALACRLTGGRRNTAPDRRVALPCAVRVVRKLVDFLANPPGVVQ